MKKCNDVNIQQNKQFTRCETHILNNYKSTGNVNNTNLQTSIDILVIYSTENINV